MIQFQWKNSTVPTLHYLSSIQPRIISFVLWGINLVSGITNACFFLIRKRKQLDVVICFLGLYYTPILLCARLLGLTAISFEPASDLVIMNSAYGVKWWWSLVKSFWLVLRRVNRSIANYIVIESMYVKEQGNLQGFERKLHQANLFVDTNEFCEKIPLPKREPIVGFLGRLSPGKKIKIDSGHCKVISRQRISV